MKILQKQTRVILIIFDTILLIGLHPFKLILSYVDLNTIEIIPKNIMKILIWNISVEIDMTYLRGSSKQMFCIILKFLNNRKCL